MMNSYLFTFFSSVLASLRSTRLGECSRYRTIERIPARQLRLQAGFDDELSLRRVSRASKVLANDPEAQLPKNEFSVLKSVLAGNEFERRVPQTREDYWQGIREAILNSNRRDTSLHHIGRGETRPYIS